MLLLSQKHSIFHTPYYEFLYKIFKPKIHVILMVYFFINYLWKGDFFMYSLILSFNRPKNILTNREEEVLIEVVNGKNNGEIANDLFISIHTAKFHVASILQKFGVTRRSGIIVKALIDGWVEVNN